MAPRRTQAQRREATMGILLDATILTLAQDGYARTTTIAVCGRAQLSQGALFRHFGSRAELIAAATAEVCGRHLSLLWSGLAVLRQSTHRGTIEALVTTIRDAARTPEHAAWHEVMVAARTDVELRALVAPTLKNFEQSLLASFEVLGDGVGRPSRLGTILLSLMHVFDSEAVTVAVYGNPALEADRVAWLTELLGRELVRAAPGAWPAVTD